MKFVLLTLLALRAASAASEAIEDDDWTDGEVEEIKGITKAW